MEKVLVVWIEEQKSHNIPLSQRIIHQGLQFSPSVVSNSLWSHGLQHARLLCPSPTSGAYSNSCPLSRWRDPTILSSIIPLSSCLQSFPASGSFQMSQLFVSGGQSIGVSTLALVLPMNTQNWSPFQGILKSLPQHHSSKAPILQCSALFIVQLSHPYMTTGKTIALTRWTFVDKVMSLLFNMLSRLVITFLPRSKRLNLMAAVTICSDFGAQKNKVSQFPLFPHLVKWCDWMPWSSFSECWALSQLFHSPLSLSSRGSLAPLHFLP